MKIKNIHIILSQLIVIVALALPINHSLNELNFFAETVDKESAEWGEELTDCVESEYDAAGSGNFIIPKVYFSQSKLFLFLAKGFYYTDTCSADVMVVQNLPKLYILFLQLKLHL